MQIWPVNKLSCEDNESIEIRAKDMSQKLWDIYVDRKTYITYGNRFSAAFIANRAVYPVVIDGDGTSKTFANAASLRKHLRRVLQNNESSVSRWRNFGS